MQTLWSAWLLQFIGRAKVKARQGRSQSGRQSSTGPSILASQAPSVEWLRRGNISKESRHVKGFPVKDRCQFSFYCDGRSDVPREPKAFQKALRLSEWLLLTKDWIPDLTDGALYYHASWMEIWPRWSQEKRRLLQIDSHVFYQ